MQGHYIELKCICQTYVLKAKENKRDNKKLSPLLIIVKSPLNFKLNYHLSVKTHLEIHYNL
jgi:hypothetical protein